VSTPSLDPVLVLTDPEPKVEPGQEVRVTLRVANPSTIVERYALDVVGPAADWIDVEPPTLSIMPGATGEVAVVLRPRRVPAPPAGTAEFAVRCRSDVDADAVALAEGRATVGGFRELAVEVAPTISRGLRKGRHRVVLTNRGNLPDRVRVVATDPAEELRFKVPPLPVEVPASGRTEVPLIAKPHGGAFLKGAPRQHRFEVGYVPVPSRPGEPEAPKLPGTFQQRPVLSGPVVALLALVVVAVGAVIALAATRKGPVSAATEAVPPALSTVQPVTPSSMSLAWEAVPGASEYVFERAVSDGLGGAPLRQETRVVDGDAVTLTWGDLPLQTEQCFRFAAVALAPVWSERVCAPLPAPAPFAAPSDVVAQPVGPGSVQVGWTPSPGAAATVVLVDGEPVGEFPGERVQLPVEPGARCFATVGKAADGSLTEPSPEVCVEVPGGPDDGTATTVGPATTAAPGTTGAGTTPPTPGTTAAPDTTVPATTGTTAAATTTAPPDTAPPTVVTVSPGWYVLLDAVPVDDVDARPRAEARQKALRDAGVAADLGRSDDLGLGGRPSWALFVDGLASRDSAGALCRTLRERALIPPTQDCLPREQR